MKTRTFAEAIEESIAQAMADDESIVIFGEDVEMLRKNLLVRFGKDRVKNTPISESAFLSAAVASSMVGLRPIVEIMMVDFITVGIDALLNHAAKLNTFSGGNWNCPMVVRVACGGGYGDGGQHQQSLWGWLAHIPGLIVVVPSTPADAGGLMLAAIEQEGPVVFLEHKLLSDYWLEFMGKGGRKNLQFDVPEQGAKGPVPQKWQALPFGKAAIRREGQDITMVSVGVGVHRALEAADKLENKNISTEVIDLRSLSPFDNEAICNSVSKTGKLLVVDEDYQQFGLSGEISAVVSEAGISHKFGRVCTKETIPYARHLEEKMLPNTVKILETAFSLLEK